jgi:hypothetical protein
MSRKLGLIRQRSRKGSQKVGEARRGLRNVDEEIGWLGTSKKLKEGRAKEKKIENGSRNVDEKVQEIKGM